MKQRIMIATALACQPDLLIADEATTALDVTVQKEILDLLQLIQQQRQMSMILVTHNLGIVAGRTDDILVLYGGHVVEYGPTDTVFPIRAIAIPRLCFRRCRAWTSRLIRNCTRFRAVRPILPTPRPDARSHRAAPPPRPAAMLRCRR